MQGLESSGGNEPGGNENQVENSIEVNEPSESYAAVHATDAQLCYTSIPSIHRSRCSVSATIVKSTRTMLAT